MIFDTDVIIFSQRGDLAARKLIVLNAAQRFISAVTYIELLQGARDKKQHALLKRFLKDFQFTVLPITEPVSTRATHYIEEYTMSHSLELADALIAATAVEQTLPLCTANVKHFKCIRELDLRAFRPATKKR